MHLARRASSRQRIVARCVAALLLVVAALAVAAPSASAAQCSFDSLNHSLSVTVTSPNDFVEVRANSGFLEVADVFCAVMADLNTVTIDSSGAPDVRLIFDLDDGPLGPGYTDEGNGSSEIEFVVNGLGPQSVIHVFATGGNDKITLGWLNNKVTGYNAGQINLNGFADGASPDNDISFPGLPGRIIVTGYGGDDVLSGSGTGTLFTGQIYVPLNLQGDGGSNQITGGGGDDLISLLEFEGLDGPDTLSGGAGHDTAQVLLKTANLNLVWGSVTLDGLANDGRRCPGVECNGDLIATDFEEVWGSAAREYIVGNGDDQVMHGGGGDDTIRGLGGNDTFNCDLGIYEGGAGSDLFLPPSSGHTTACGTMSGGPGVDTVDFRTYPISVDFSLDDVPNDGAAGTMNLRSDIENLIGTAFEDKLSGSSRANVLDGLAGRDTLLGRDGDDTLFGRGGPDRLNGGPGTDTCKQGPGVGTSIGCEAA